MELAATAFASAFGGGAATAAPAAAASAGALGGLQTAATAIGMVSQLFAGFSAYSEANTQARFARISAENERLQAEEQANRIRREYVQKVGAARVAFAGAGLDISSGVEIEDALKQGADYASETARRSGTVSAAGWDAQASMFKSRGLAGLVKAGSGALTSGFGLAMDLSKRG